MNTAPDSSGSPPEGISLGLVQLQRLMYWMFPANMGGGGASQVALWQRIQLPMQETQEMQVRSLGREDPLEK